MSPSVSVPVSVCGFFGGEKLAAPDDQRSNQICYRPRPRPIHCLSVDGVGVCYPKKIR